MWWLVRECIVGDGCKVEFNAFFNGQPVKLMKEVCAGAVWMARLAPEDNAGNRILGLLQLNQVEFGAAIENRVAIVKARLNKGNFDCSGSVIGEGSCGCDEEHGCDRKGTCKMMRHACQE